LTWAVAFDKGVALSGITAVPRIIEYQILKMSTGFVVTVPVKIFIVERGGENET